MFPVRKHEDQVHSETNWSPHTEDMKPNMNFSFRLVRLTLKHLKTFLIKELFVPLSYVMKKKVQQQFPYNNGW